MTAAETTTVVMAAGPILGSVGMSGLTLTTGIALLAGLRGSDRVSLNRDKAGGVGIAFGTLAVAAGSLWGEVAGGVAGVSTALVEGGAMGDIGMGGTALAVTACTFLPRWKRMIWPALLGISAGVLYAEAGGIWAIGHNLVIRLAGVLGAL
ncbi:hypothetical protein [Streptomyces diastaticus]|uniref:hypothetical protein n=1 Tax=Streptomyces diastaticus TaxID=1956 RepID=UPI00381D0067